MPICEHPKYSFLPEVEYRYPHYSKNTSVDSGAELSVIWFTFEVIEGRSNNAHVPCENEILGAVGACFYLLIRAGQTFLSESYKCSLKS